MSQPSRPVPGDRAEVTAWVGEGDTAMALGSGEVPVLGTPRLIALCEAATVAAVGENLEPAETTVGIDVHIEHLAPSPVGVAIRAVAVLDDVEERILRFSVEAFEGETQIGRGRVVRAIVDRRRFLGSV